MSGRPAEAAPFPATLPAPEPPLIGRAAEVEAAIDAVVTDGHRLVTLTGTGGVGKTRVAVEIGHRLWGKFDASVLFVPVRFVTAAEAVAAAVGRAAGWEFDDQSDARSVVVAALSNRPAVVVLDNVEQIPDLGPVIADWLAMCPELTIVVTTRRALGIAGERVVTLRPFAGPRPAEVAELAAHPAVALLVGAARRHDPAFDVTRADAAAIVELCTRLDGLPLALELAAARLRLITPAEIVRLLDARFDLLTAPSAEGSLDAAIDWSYRLLGDDDQRRLRALGVFPDTFPLGGAAAVTGDDPVAALDALTRLVDHHLVEPAGRTGGSGRFALLESIGEFARARLAAAGETAAVGTRHAEWCTALTERTAPELTGADGQAAFAELDAEQPSLRTALAWAVDGQRPGDTVARLMADGWRYWQRSGLGGVALAALEAALPTTSTPEHLARGLRAAGLLADGRGRHSQAVERFERGAALFAELGDALGHARTLNDLAAAERELGHADRAAELHVAAATTFRRLGESRSEASAINGLGNLAYQRNAMAEAVTYFRRAYEVVERIGDTIAMSVVAGNLGNPLGALGDHAGAIEAYTRSVELAEQIGDRPQVAMSLANRAESELRRGDLAACAADLERAAAEAEAIGDDWVLSYVRLYRGELAAAGDELGAAAGWFVETIVRGLADDQPMQALDAAERLATVAAELGADELAGDLFTLAAAARTVTGTAPDDHTGIAYWSKVAGGAAADAPPDSGFEWQPALRARIPAAEAFAAAHATAVRRRSDRKTALRRLGLSAREAEVALLVAAHRTAPEIAAELYIGVRTAESHVAAAIRKLGVATRRDIPAKLVELGIPLTGSVLR